MCRLDMARKTDTTQFSAKAWLANSVAVGRASGSRFRQAVVIARASGGRVAGTVGMNAASFPSCEFNLFIFGIALQKRETTPLGGGMGGLGGGQREEGR